MLIAVPFALFISQTHPSTSLLAAVAAVPLLIAFVSPMSGLYLLVFSMLLGPEFLVGGIGSGNTLGRGVTLRFDDFLLMLVGIGWLARVAVSEHGKVFVRTSLNRPIMLYTIACVFATLIGILAGRVRPIGGLFFLLKYYEYFFLFFMTVNLVKTKEQVKHLVTASLVTCFLVSLYAISQIPSGMRVSAPFEGQDGEPNTLGGYLVFTMALIGGLLVTPGAVQMKWLLVALLAVAGFALQATLSRASFLAAGVVLVGFVLLLRRRSPGLVALVLAGCIVLAVLAPRAVIERMTYTFGQPEEQGQIHVGSLRVDTSTSERIQSWSQSFKIWKTSPLWGHGVTGGPFMDAMYPRVFVEVGLLGACAFAALLYALFRTGRISSTHFEDPYLRGLSLGFLMGFVGLLIHALGSNTFIIVRIMEPFWLVAGLLVKSLLMDQHERGSIDDLSLQAARPIHSSGSLRPPVPRPQPFPGRAL
ncbi:MAG: O-antigen ligase family protein [Nitrospirae bacterium]|nr:O-antigen ligase family protein [Nitrospirota bacterium]